MLAIISMIENEVRKFSAHFIASAFTETPIVVLLEPKRMLESLSKLSNILAGANCSVCLKQPELRLFKQSIFYRSHLFLGLQDLSIHWVNN